MLHAFDFINFSSLVIRIALLTLAFSQSFAAAQSIDLEHKSTWSYQLSMDAWHWRANTEADYIPGQLEQNSNLLLPNSFNKWHFKNTSLSGWVIGNFKLNNDTEVSLKARVDQVLGMRVDEAQIQKDISPYLGIRAGIVDYKTSWCRTYEADNVWMREIEAICSTPQLRDVTGGAPGFQIFARQTFNDLLVQGQIGVYDPLILGYAPKEFNNLIISPRFEVQSNKKYGFNLNAVHLQTGLEARLSFIHTFQTGWSPETNLQGLTKQKSDLLYMGLSFPLSTNLRTKLTHTHQTQKDVCLSEVAAISSACNQNLSLQKRALSLELNYQLNAINSIAAGYTTLTFNKQQQFFTPSADIYILANPNSYATKQAAIAWRHEWGNNIFTIVQHIQAKQVTTFELTPFPSRGNAIGFRMGYRF